MKIFLSAPLAGALLVSAADARVKCHHYSRWFYPHPQTCRQARYVASVPPVQPEPVQPAAINFLTPDLVEQLKVRLRHRDILDGDELLLSRAGMLGL